MLWEEVAAEALVAWRAVCGLNWTLSVLGGAVGFAVMGLSTGYASRYRIAGAGVVVIAIGIVSRTLGARLPVLISKHVGDLLWGTLFFLLVLFIFPRLRMVAVVLIAFGIASLTELLKLYHAPWIDGLRGTPGIGFVLGERFDAGNFVTYGAGCLVGCLLKPVLLRSRLQPQLPEHRS